MTKEEFVAITKTIKTAYPRENVFPNKETMELWWRLINDLPYDLTIKSTAEWIAENSWQPTIADIRNAVAKKQRDIQNRIAQEKIFKELLGDEYIQICNSIDSDNKKELAADNIRKIPDRS